MSCVGPLLSLKALMVKYLPPWKPDHIIHIGVEPIFTGANTPNSKRLSILGAPEEFDLKLQHLLYLQWCEVNATISPSDGEAQCENPDHNTEHLTSIAIPNVRKGVLYTLNDAMVYSTQTCETKWIGDLDI
jgi:hypothetical protein